jgi:CheY-like chemotaxis protein
LTEPERTQRQSILVVDDEPGIVDVLTAVLEDAGYRVTGAGNGQKALAQLAEAVPDLMLLDFEMPLLDGASTLRRLQGAAARAIPVVMMSGVPESMVQRRCRGYRAFLRKPFSLDELLETVRQVLLPARPGPRTEHGSRAPRGPGRSKQAGRAASGASRTTTAAAARESASRKNGPRSGAAHKKRRGGR